MTYNNSAFFPIGPPSPKVRASSLLGQAAQNRKPSTLTQPLLPGRAGCGGSLLTSSLPPATLAHQPGRILPGASPWGLM